MSRAARRLRQAAGASLGIAVLLAWFVLLRPASLGGDVDYLVIRGDSMQPTYQTGDLVIVRRAADYRAGDIVAYHVPAGELGAGLLVIHRLVEPVAGGAFSVQGDNNPAPDPWQPRATDIAGRAWLHLPGIGRLVATLHQPALLAALAVSLLAALAAWSRRGAAPVPGPARAPAPAPARVPAPEVVSG